MQSENFDKKLKDSLSQRPPGNDIPAWDKMEPLLDKHMPVKKDDRRRIIFIMFLFLLLGGGAFLIWKNNQGSEKNITEAKPVTENPTQKDNTSGSKNNSPERSATIEPSSNSTQPKNDWNEVATSQKTEQTTRDKGSNSIKQNKTTVITKSVSEKRADEKVNNNKIKSIKPNKQKSNPDTNPQTVTSIEKSDSQKNISPVDNSKQDRINESQKPIEQQKSEELTKTESDNKSDKKKTEENKIDEQQKSQESQPILTANTKSKKQKSGSSFLNNLFFSVSAGPDLSLVKFDYAGKVKPVYGAGLGYMISRKLSVQTGFYVGRKIYSADPDDYYIPQQYLYYYPKLKPIEADCKVYEVPLSLSYHFNTNKKQSWFASVGSSSLFMKKEKYDYYYKSRITYNDTTSTRILNNQNQHYFSTLNLAGGYERKINEHLTLQAEPYMKIALTGIGSGKVKLNSGGVLFTAVIKPFARKSNVNH